MKQTAETSLQSCFALFYHVACLSFHFVSALGLEKGAKLYFFMDCVIKEAFEKRCHAAAIVSEKNPQHEFETGVGWEIWVKKKLRSEIFLLSLLAKFA